MLALPLVTRALLVRFSARRFVKNLERWTTIAEEKEEEGEDERPVTISPVGRSATGHSTDTLQFLLVRLEFSLYFSRYKIYGRLM